MTIFGKHVPAEWTDALLTVQSVIPEAILAGGALRDLILGGEVKDLDVFVPADPQRRLENLFEVLQFRHGWRQITTIPAGYVGTMRDEVAYVAGYRVPSMDTEVQIIALKQMETAGDAVRRMDFGACQIGMLSPTHFVWTDEAFLDLSSRRITMLPPADEVQSGRSLLRADRFRQKYGADGCDVVVDTSAGDRFLRAATLPWEQPVL
jgi:hypothetical protein